MYKKILSAPHIMLWSLIPVFLVMGLLGVDDTLNINIHDTYFVIELWKYMLLNIFILFGFGLWYWLCMRFKLKLIPRLSAIHAIGTVISLLIIFYYLGFDFRSSLPRRFIESIYSQDVLLGNIILFFLSQIAMVINSFILLIRRIKVLIRK